MDKFLHRHNFEKYRRQLAESKDQIQRQTLPPKKTLHVTEFGERQSLRLGLLSRDGQDVANTAAI